MINGPLCYCVVQLSDLLKGQKTLIICHSGHRVGRGFNRLRTQGARTARKVSTVDDVALAMIISVITVHSA